MDPPRAHWHRPGSHSYMGPVQGSRGLPGYPAVLIRFLGFLCTLLPLRALLFCCRSQAHTVNQHPGHIRQSTVELLEEAFSTLLSLSLSLSLSCPWLYHMSRLLHSRHLLLPTFSHLCGWLHSSAQRQQLEDPTYVLPVFQFSTLPLTARLAHTRSRWFGLGQVTASP